MDRIIRMALNMLLLRGMHRVMNMGFDALGKRKKRNDGDVVEGEWQELDEQNKPEMKIDKGKLRAVRRMGRF